MKQPDLPLSGQLAATQQAPPVSPAIATVFLSYSHQDHDFVLRLQTDLRAQGIHIWVDHEDLEPGTRDWEEAIRDAIRQAHAVVLIASPNSRQSLYVNDELSIADMYKLPIYPIWAAGEQWMEAIHLGWGKTQYIDARGTSFENGVQQLVAVLRDLPATPSGLIQEPSVELKPLFEPRNPYKGLQAFGVQDVKDFFGRETLITELLNGLKESLAGEEQSIPGKRLEAVMGPSGSGKSSVMLAGLLPRLQQGILADSEHWAYLGPMTPGAHPLENLALALAPQLPDRSLKSIGEDLQDDEGRGLHLLVRAMLKQHEKRAVLLIDQFEELFTLTTDEREQRLFVNELLTAVSEPGGPLLVLLTLRSDFYDRLSQYPKLAILIKDHHQLVLPMELEDLRAVIEGPAALPDVQMSFEGPLVGDLLFEVQGQPGALPLLQFTLDQLFQRRSGHQLTLAAYQAIGGLRGALRQHAEATYAALPSDEHRRLARALFVRLIDPGATERDTTRRRATFSELTLPSPKQTELMRQTVDAFIAERLLVANEIAGTTTIEVSHEALIREWPLLGEWMREAREDDIRLQQAISAAVANWEQRGKPADRLYRGSQLKEAQAWASRNIPSRNEVEFLRASLARRRQWLVSVSVIFLLLIATTGIASWYTLHPPQPQDPTVVNTRQDSVVGSLRYCIDNAPSGSTIRFAPSLSGTIELTGGGLVFAGGKRLTIIGPGANTLTISGGQKDASIRISQGAEVNIFGLSFKHSTTIIYPFLLNEGTLTLNNSIISNNITSTGAASFGGGIFNSGTLTVKDSTISNNISGGNQYGQGGGIYNVSTLTVIDSTFSGNTAASSNGNSGNSNSGNGNSNGGGIFNGGTLTVTNSTFSGNTAASSHGNSYGGGIYNESTLTVTNSTFSGNTASGSSSYGGGIDNTSTDSSLTTISGNIIAANSARDGPDILGVLTSDGYNLITNFTGAKGLNARTDRQVKLADLKMDPMLRNNGGPTRTFALLPGSLAIGAVPGKACSITVPDVSGHTITITTDERGVPRLNRLKNACDSGAYESSNNAEAAAALATATANAALQHFTVGGTEMILSLTTTSSRHDGQNIIYSYTEQVISYGDTLGSFTSELTSVVHPDNTANFYGSSTCTCQVAGKSVTLIWSFSGTQKADLSFQGQYFDVHGTGDLAKLHGQGEFQGLASYETYSGEWYFDA